MGETHRFALLLVLVEGGGGDETLDRQVMRRGLEILADGENVTAALGVGGRSGGGMGGGGEEGREGRPNRRSCMRGGISWGTEEDTSELQSH